MFAGLVGGPMLVAIAGFIHGGIIRAAPCHEAPDFLSGGVFGVFIYCALLGIPAGVVGIVAGGILGVWTKPRERDDSIRPKDDVYVNGRKL
jgi:hypothetical protein